MWQDVPVVISEPSSGIREELRKSKTVYYIYKENLENKKKEEIKKEKKQVANIEEHWGEIASSRECQLTDEDLQILKDFIKDL